MPLKIGTQSQYLHYAQGGFNLMANSGKTTVLREALEAHAQAQHEYDRLLRAVAIAEQVLGLTREALEAATTAIKEEGAE